MHTARCLRSFQLGIAMAADYHTVFDGDTTQLCSPAADLAPAGPDDFHEWHAYGDMMLGLRGDHTATRLLDGRVLLCGGANGVLALKTAILFNPITKTWTKVTEMATARRSHAATRLPDGRVLVCGGDNGEVVVSSCILFDPDSLDDPDTEAWTDAPQMKTGRRNHTATTLLDGSVLVCGGAAASGPKGVILATAEQFAPITKYWTNITEMLTKRRSHTATMLFDGRVLVCGGATPGDVKSLDTAILFDPRSQKWTEVIEKMKQHRRSHSATSLLNGHVLIWGGFCSIPSQLDGDPSTGTPKKVYPDRIAELFDPNAAPDALNRKKREDHTATGLSDGSVLICGGNADWNCLQSTELWCDAAALALRESEGHVAKLTKPFPGGGYNPRHDRSLPETLETFGDQQRSKLVGQTKQVKDIKQQLQKWLHRMIRGSGCLVLAVHGPPGCGKTEVARLISEIVHKEPHQALAKTGKYRRFDMTNFGTQESANSFFGANPGYQGGDGDLYEAVRAQPTAVIHLDEMEKCYTNVRKTSLLAALDGDAAEIRSNQGGLPAVSAAGLVFVLTTNLEKEQDVEKEFGAAMNSRMTSYFFQGNTMEEMERLVQSLLLDERQWYAQLQPGDKSRLVWNVAAERTLVSQYWEQCHTYNNNRRRADKMVRPNSREMRKFALDSVRDLLYEHRANLPGRVIAVYAEKVQPAVLKLKIIVAGGVSARNAPARAESDSASARPVSHADTVDTESTSTSGAVLRRPLRVHATAAELQTERAATAPDNEQATAAAAADLRTAQDALVTAHAELQTERAATAANATATAAAADLRIVVAVRTELQAARAAIAAAAAAANLRTAQEELQTAAQTASELENTAATLKSTLDNTAATLKSTKEELQTARTELQKEQKSHNATRQRVTAALDDALQTLKCHRKALRTLMYASITMTMITVLSMAVPLLLPAAGLAAYVDITLTLLSLANAAAIVYATYVAWPYLKRQFEQVRKWFETWWPWITWIATVLGFLWRFGAWLLWLMGKLPPGIRSTVLIVVLIILVGVVWLVTKGFAAVIGYWQLTLAYSWGEMVCEETEKKIEAARPTCHDHARPCTRDNVQLVEWRADLHCVGCILQAQFELKKR